MHVKGIKLINYRNYRSLDITLNPKLNIFLGNNAQGKTNLLESIYIAAMGKSYRTNKDKELINLRKNQAYIAVDVVKEDFNKKIEVKLDRENQKKARVNKVEVDKISELYGILNVVIFSPEDLSLVKDGPSGRRNFLDNEISQIRPKYRYNLNRYNKILNQRNNLLKRIAIEKSKVRLLDIWDEQLVSIGTELLINRIEFLNKLSTISKDIQRKISGNLEEMKLEYLSSFRIDNVDYDTIKDKFGKILKENVKEDIKRGSTKYGPHRDDIGIFVNNMDIRIFGSQGQQRTAALSLKLAEVELIKWEVGEYPVLLLDDVLSELDQNRRKYLVSSFKDIQTIITTTDDLDINEFNNINKSIFNIRSGMVQWKENTYVFTFRKRLCHTN